MPKVKVKQRVVDPVTGSVSYKQRTVTISTNDSYNSIQYHKLADLLELDPYVRTIRDVSHKVAMIYNHLVSHHGTDNLDTILKSLKSRIKREGFTNVTGTELVKKLYRSVRLEMDRVKAMDREREKAETQRKIKEEIRGNRKRATELRGSKEPHELAKSEKMDKLTKDTKQKAREISRTSKEMAGPKEVKTSVREIRGEKINIKE